MLYCYKLIPMNKLSKKSKSVIIYSCLLIMALITIFLSFSYTINGKFVFMSGLFLEDKTLFDLSFNVSILGTIALIVCAIGLNSSGEVIQATTNNPLASPFSLGLTSSINLVYIINSAQKTTMSPYIIGLISILFITVLNIIPLYFINKNKTRKTQNNLIFFGLAMASLLNTITLVLVHIYSLDRYVYGWITNYKASVNLETLTAGLVFIFFGAILIFFNLKKLSVYERMYFKSNTLGIDSNRLVLMSMFGGSLLAVGASLVYAPMMLLGLVLPYLTKKFIIKKFSFKHSIIISSLLSIIVLLLSRIIMGFIKWDDYNLMLCIVLLPMWVICESIYRVNKKIETKKYINVNQ